MTIPGSREDGPSAASESSSTETPGDNTNGQKEASSSPSHGDPATRNPHPEPEKINSKDPPEDIEELNRMCRQFTYPGMPLSVLIEERETGNLITRSKQAALHFSLTEQRIGELETSLRKLDAAVRNLPPDFSYDRTIRRHWGRYQPRLKRCSRDEFNLNQPWGRGYPVSSIVKRDWPAMEVLTSEATVPGRNNPTGAANFGDCVAKVPERFRVRYQPLLIHLNSATNSTTWPDTEESGIVFLRPFKYFVKHETAIRNSLPQLEESLRQAKESNDKESKSHKKELMAKGSGLAGAAVFSYDDLISNLKLLIEFMDVDLKPLFEMRKQIADGTLQEIQYADLWHLFERGDYVLSGSRSTEAFEVVNATGGREPLIPLWDDKDTPSAPVDGFVVDCTNLVFNGQEIVPRLSHLRISPFQGFRRISSLEVYPLKFSPQREEVEAALLSNGAAYLQLASKPFCHRMLKGATLDEPPQDLDAQVIVDTVLATNMVPSWRVAAEAIPESKLTLCDHRETCLENACTHGLSYNSGCCGSDRAFQDLKLDIADRDTYVRSSRKLGPVKLEDLPVKARMLLPNWVHGFVLRSRQWVTTKIADLHPVQFFNDFEELILPTNHKKTIRALVEIHENSRIKAAATPTSAGAGLDLVKGKGTGLVILLHGEPGVGKTSTAECIADTTKRPLFPITCGDIGETPLEAEKNLHSNFRMAQKWDCVLLLDEADVFLAKRTQMDIRQNAITSVFLRSLEYYGGILFLTTNRVGGIDPAFKSRVHMALLYPALDLEATKKLYTVFVNRTREEQQRTGNARFKIKQKEILRFAKHHYKQLHKLKGEGITTWNGRQIRNAFQTAIALVEHDALRSEEGQPPPTLGKAQFDLVADASRQFDEYLTQAIGKGETAMAVYDRWRADPLSGNQDSVKGKGKSATGKAKESEDEDSDDSSSDDSSDDDPEDDEDGEGLGVSGKKQGGKTAKGGSKKEAAEASATPKVETEADDEMAQFEAFMKFQAMMKKGKMAS